MMSKIIVELSWVYGNTGQINDSYSDRNNQKWIQIK